MQMISKKDMSSAELETVTTSRSPTTVITANGEVQTHEEATHFLSLNWTKFLTMKVLEYTPAVLSLRKLCDEHGYQSWFLVYQRVLPQACLLQHP